MGEAGRFARGHEKVIPKKLGEGEQAQGIAIGWLRPKLLLATPA